MKMGKSEEIVRKLAEQEKEQNARMEKNIKRKSFCHKISLVYNPIAALTFVGIYWAVGLKNAQIL